MADLRYRRRAAPRERGSACRRSRCLWACQHGGHRRPWRTSARGLYDLISRSCAVGGRGCVPPTRFLVSSRTAAVAAVSSASMSPATMANASSKQFGRRPAAPSDWRSASTRATAGAGVWRNQPHSKGPTRYRSIGGRLRMARRHLILTAGGRAPTRGRCTSRMGWERRSSRSILAPRGQLGKARNERLRALHTPLPCNLRGPLG